MRLEYPALAKRTPMRHLAVGLLALGLVACEDEPAPRRPAPVNSDSAEPAAAVTSAPPKQPTKPDLEIDSVSTKVGFERALLQNPEGRAKLAALVSDAKAWIEGKEIVLIVDRKAKVAWVAAYLDELAKHGPAKLMIRTETRKDYSAELRFIPETKVQAAPCSVVGMVTSDYGTAVWKLSGGAAGKRGRGMAGPDLSMTGDTIERLGKACKESSTFFVAVANGIEWGLAYDLAASSRVLEHAKFDASVLLGEAPVPGHKITLKR